MTAEGERDELYARLEEILGDQQAATLMEYLPPEPVGGLATTAHLVHMGDELGGRIDRMGNELGGRIDRMSETLGIRLDGLEDRIGRVEHRMDRLDDRMHGFHDALRDRTRNLVLATLGSMVTLAALAFGAAALI